MTDASTTRPIDKSDFQTKARYKVVVPANLDSKTSDTSYCEDCFAGQRFSKNLQRFMIDYAIKVSGKNPMTDK